MEGRLQRVEDLLLPDGGWRNTMNFNTELPPPADLFNRKGIAMKRVLIVCAALCIVLAVIGCDMVKKSDGKIEQSSMVVAANETAAISRLRSIANAEFNYQAESGGEYGTLDQLIDKGIIGDPSRGKLTGYKFEVRVRPGGFEATAVPERAGLTGIRSFYINESRIVRGADKKGESATEFDPEV